jgi:hypothetical protein
MRDRVELLAELPDSLGALLDRKAVPEERVEVGHLFPTVAKDAAFPAGPGGPSLCSVHGRNIATTVGLRSPAYSLAYVPSALRA